MLVLHIANKNYSSWSLRPWLLMRMVGIPFEERLHAFPPDGDWTELLALSPSGKVPCLVDGDIVVWDSLAITEHLADTFHDVWPYERKARAFARSAAAEMHSGFSVLRSRCAMSIGVRVRHDQVAPELQADLDRLAALWSDGLARFGGPYLAGERFTAVDAFFAPVAFRIQTYGLTLPDACLDYAERLRALGPMREWYAAGLAEPWREAGHDAECLAAASLLEDLRA